LLAPQRGLFATVESKSKNKSKNLAPVIRLPETSNFYCLPGKAGGTPGILDKFPLSHYRSGHSDRISGTHTSVLQSPLISIQLHVERRVAVQLRFKLLNSLLTILGDVDIHRFL